LILLVPDLANFYVTLDQESTPKVIMNRPKWIAIVTGAIALLLSFAYLLLVQLLDFRGEMLPAPVDLSVLPSLFSIWG